MLLGAVVVVVVENGTSARSPLIALKQNPIKVLSTWHCCRKQMKVYPRILRKLWHQIVFVKLTRFFSAACSSATCSPTSSSGSVRRWSAKTRSFNRCERRRRRRRRTTRRQLGARRRRRKISSRCGHARQSTFFVVPACP